MTFEIIFQHTVDDQTLTVIDGLLINLIPKLRLEQNIAKRGFSARKVDELSRLAELSNVIFGQRERLEELDNSRVNTISAAG